MNEIKTFENTDFGSVRTLTIEGEPYFVGKDVAEILGYANSRDAITRHVDYEDKADVVIHDGSQNRNMTVINESGLYSLILSSKLPQAKQFKRWVTSEVLPAIRKHHAYISPDKVEELLLNPGAMIKVLTALKDEQDKRKALEVANSALTVDNQIMLPKAEYFDELVDRKLNTSFRDTAKELGIKEKRFIAFLIEHKYIYRDKKGRLMPYATKNDGLFELKEWFNDKSDCRGVQTLVTPKGRETFRLLCVGL